MSQTTNNIELPVVIMDIWTLIKTVVTLPFITNIEKLERRVHFIRTGISDVRLKSFPAKQIVSIYDKRIQQITHCLTKIKEKK